MCQVAFVLLALSGAANGARLHNEGHLRAAAKRVSAKQPLTLDALVNKGEIVHGMAYYNSQQNIYAMQPEQVSPQKEVQDWREFDSNNDGYIEQREMDAYLYELENNGAATKEDAKVIFSKLDLDGNGVVDYREFSTPLDTELFDFLDRTHNQETVKEIEMVEDLYTRQFGNPMAAMKSLPPAEYNMQGEQIQEASADEKYLAGYGWFKGESPVIDEMYKGELIDSPNKLKEELHPDAKYAYSYGL